MAVDFEAEFLKADNFRNSGKVDQAVESYANIARMAEAENNNFELGRALHGAAIAAFQSADGKESSYLRDGLKYLHKSAEVFRSLDDVVRLGMVYRDAGAALAKVENNAQALEYFQKSIAELQQSDEFGELGSTYTKLGNYYLANNDLESASQYFQKALECFKKDPTRGYYLASTFFSIASLNLKKKDYLEAYDVALQSLSWFEADHGGERYDYRLVQLYGLLSIICTHISMQRDASKYGLMFEKGLKNIDPRAAKNIQSRLEALL